MAFARVSSSPRLTSLRLRIEQKRSCISNARPETDVCANHQLATLPIARQLGSSKKSPAIRTSTQRGTRDRRRQSLPSHNAWRTTLPFPETQTLWGKEREQSQSRTAGKSYRQLATRAGSSGLLQKPPTGQDHVGAKPEAEPPFLDTWGPDTPAAHIPNPFQDATPTRGNAFESPQHLRELAVPEETKRFIRVLQNPYEGSLVYLIGTAHVSRASVDDVRLLIEAVKPDVVAVELDREALELIECDSTAASAEVSFRTTWGALRVVRKLYSGRFGRLWSAYQPYFDSQALGIRLYGCDTRSAVKAARRIGAHIEPIDQGVASIASGLEEFDQAQLHEGATLKVMLSRTVEVSQSVALMLQLLKDPSKKFDGQDSGADALNEATALGRILAAFLEGRSAPLNEIAVFQSSKNKALEATRLGCFKGEVLPAFDETKGPDAYTALIHERDRLMGLKLAALASNCPKVVAVVGAAHVPGITSRFAQYTAAAYGNAFDEGWEESFRRETRLDDQKRRGGERSVQRKGRQSKRRENWELDFAGLVDVELLRRGVVFGTAAWLGAFAWCTWPVTTTEIITGAFTAHGLVTLGLAVYTAKWAQFGEYLEAASHALELRRKRHPEFS